ncbi:damage-inducible protein CinA [Arthrobacter pityocampae]|uniref:Damage-inducible protein CinA n=1 Tax=Arthrobacter pityocampae TaxID=547334 RepID=A0A2S5IXU9_9MICC|nr:nicotinamide-nucleotide amidohydrolase family protein [Arthrobacter pityocampae]PPB49398.1 damage-inducible protein CinA [Arthrobacter pityocampae]
MTGAGRAADVVGLATRRGLTVATAESLTAGMVAATLADVPGASSVLQGGVVAYQISVKQKLLNVDADLLARAGAVDARVAAAMADGARAAFSADIGVATTGVAGPSPHEGKPVGTVFTAISTASGTTTAEHHFSGGRDAIRAASRDAVLDELHAVLVGGTKSDQG